MSETGLVARIFSRAEATGLHLDAKVVAGCAAYVSLLAKWNLRINLTALPLEDPIPDASIDKLIVEPLLAAALFPTKGSVWFDLGSGGGSPAIPLRIARPDVSLALVESRERKCAFLREVVRSLNLEHVHVIADRFADLHRTHSADLITFRAVRVDDTFADVLDGLLAPDGAVLSFGSAVADARFRTDRELRLPDGSTLFVVRRVH